MLKMPQISKTFILKEQMRITKIIAILITTLRDYGEAAMCEVQITEKHSASQLQRQMEMLLIRPQMAGGGLKIV